MSEIAIYNQIIMIKWIEVAEYANFHFDEIESTIARKICEVRGFIASGKTVVIIEENVAPKNAFRLNGHSGSFIV